MDLILAVLAVALIVAGVVWTMRGLGMIRDFKADAVTQERLHDLEVACHDLKSYIDKRTPALPPGNEKGAWTPIVIQGKDPEIEGAAPEMLQAHDLQE